MSHVPKTFDALADYVSQGETHAHCRHLGCILPRVPAISCGQAALHLLPLVAAQSTPAAAGGDAGFETGIVLVGVALAVVIM